MRVRTVVVRRMVVGICIVEFWGMVLVGGRFGGARFQILELWPFEVVTLRFSIFGE